MRAQTLAVRWVGAALAVITAAGILVRAARLPYEPHLGLSERRTAIGMIEPGGPADRAGLRPGDRFVSIDGRGLEEISRLSDALRGGGPGRGLALVVERDGVKVSAVLVPDSLPPSELAWKLASAAVALGTLLIGTAVYLRRVRRLTITFFGICLIVANLLTRTFAFSHPLLRHLDAAVEALAFLLPGLLVHFFLLFPYERVTLRRRRYLEVLPYLPGLALLLVAGWLAKRAAFAGGDPGSLGAILEAAAAAYFGAAVAASVVLFAQAYRGSQLPTIRRKLKVTMAGTLLALLPTVVVILLHTMFPATRIPGDRLASLMLFLLPASFGYAIVRHGIFEIEFIVKRSLVYSGLTATLIFSYFLAYFILRLALHNVSGLNQRIGTILALAFAFLLVSPVRGRIQNRIDRWVYPDRYEPDRGLAEIGQALQEAARDGSVDQVLLRAARSLLGVETAGLFRPVRGEEDFALAASYNDGPPPSSEETSPPGIAPAPRLGRLLANTIFHIGHPTGCADLEAELPYGFLPTRDLSALAAFRAHVLIPLSAGSRRLGILLLGPRAYHEPYSPQDIDLLAGLQAQAVLAMDNVLYRDESAGRADLQREMEVARSLQRQLLPTQLPRADSLEIAASNIPSREVGGDYYDCLAVNGGLTVAIGDVSGKGVPAALLMANVQATFRAEALAGRLPAEVLERMNRRLCEIDRPDRFVSFFCGHLEIESGTFVYCNGGHLMPIVVRRQGKIERLERGGLLLGIFEEARYETGATVLDPGDLLLLFTDGVVERGGADTAFDETALEEVALRHRHLSADDLLGRIGEELVRLTGPEIVDDTTLLLLKRT